MGKYDLSESLIIKAIKLEPDKADYFYLLGKIYIQKAENYKARGSFFAALKINPQHEKTLYALGNLYSHEYKLKEAKKYYEFLLMHNENHVNALCELAYMGYIDRSSSYYVILKRHIENNKVENVNIYSRLLLAKGFILHYEKKYSYAFKYIKEANLNLKTTDDKYIKATYEKHVSLIKK